METNKSDTLGLLKSSRIAMPRENDHKRVAKSSGSLTDKQDSDMTDRAALRNIAQNARSGTLQNLSESTNSDIQKGNDVHFQRKTFNLLLDTRMRLQRSIAAANVLPSVHKPMTESSTDRDAVEAAEEAALDLVVRVSSLRNNLLSAHLDPRGTKRPFSATKDDALERTFETLKDLEQSTDTYRRTTLDRWAKRTAPAAKLAKSNMLKHNSDQPSLIAILNSQIDPHSTVRLTSRVDKVRNRASSDKDLQKVTDRYLYDDRDWYTTLLRELIESKAVSSNAKVFYGNGDTSPIAASASALRHEVRLRRSNLDVKASKGRKMNFSVQERIQNFWAPDDRTTWAEKQTRELFGSLMGHRVVGALRESENLNNSTDSAEGEKVQEGVLRLFEG